ncbi:MAG: glycosyltransferase family 39 protein [Vicinamibacteria bacterium]
MAEEGPAPPSTRSLQLALVGLAVVVRLLHLAHVEPSPLFEFHRTFHESDMYMFDQWAQRIVAGDVLGRETYHPLVAWQIATAPVESWKGWYGDEPTFYKAPGYAYLIAGLYAVFREVMLPLALLQIAAAAAAVWLLFRMTERLFGQEPAFFASLFLAVYSPAIHFDVAMLRGPWIVLASLAATWQLMRLIEIPSPRGAVALGLLLGLSLVVNEGFLTVPPLVLLVLWLCLPRSGRRWPIAGFVLLGTAAAVAPVVARNVAVGAPAFKLAVTGGMVYAVCNSAASSPYFFEARASAFVPILAESGGSLSRAAVACLRSFPTWADAALFYLRKASGLVIPFENPDNANFYHAALKDPLLAALPGYEVLMPLALIGLVLAIRSWRALVAFAPYPASVLLALLLTLPLSRYRVTLVVFMMPFAGLALAAGVTALRHRHFLRLGAGLSAAAALALSAAALQSRLVFAGRPAGLFLYRPAEFLLSADAYAQRGRYAAALHEIEELLSHNPDRTIRPAALLQAARFQVEQGQLEPARQDLGLALEASGNDPAVLMAVGDLERHLLHDEARAKADYEQALDLVPPGPIRLELLSRLGRSERREGP